MAAVKKAALARLNLPAKVAIGVLLLVLPVVGYYIVFHSEVQSQINAARNSSTKLKAELVKAKKAEHAYQKDLEELRERERSKRELLKVLPATTEYPAFLSSVQSVANLVGVELLAWTPQQEVPEEFYARVPMNLKLRGRFHQLAKFFYNVGQLDRIINMENISITEPVLKDGEIRLQIKVLATAFHALDEEVEPKTKRKGRRKRK